MTELVHELGSKQEANFFIRGLINGSLVHKRFIKTPAKDMSEVQTKVEGIIRVEENRQRAAKNAAIIVSQKNTQGNFSKCQEMTKKPGGKATKVQRKN